MLHTPGWCLQGRLSGAYSGCQRRHHGRLPSMGDHGRRSFAAAYSRMQVTPGLPKYSFVIHVSNDQAKVCTHKYNIPLVSVHAVFSCVQGPQYAHAIRLEFPFGGFGDIQDQAYDGVGEMLPFCVNFLLTISLWVCSRIFRQCVCRC